MYIPVRKLQPPCERPSVDLDRPITASAPEKPRDKAELVAAVAKQLGVTPRPGPPRSPSLFFGASSLIASELGAGGGEIANNRIGSFKTENGTPTGVAQSAHPARPSTSKHPPSRRSGESGSQGPGEQKALGRTGGGTAGGATVEPVFPVSPVSPDRASRIPVHSRGHPLRRTISHSARRHLFHSRAGFSIIM